MTRKATPEESAYYSQLLDKERARVDRYRAAGIPVVSWYSGSGLTIDDNYKPNLRSKSKAVQLVRGVSL